MELSALDIKVLVQELQALIHAKVNRVYQPAHEELLLQLHSTGEGKQFLRLVAGAAIFRAEAKAETPAAPSPYCQQVRNLLEGGVITEITQLGFERIVRFRLKLGPEERFL